MFSVQDDYPVELYVTLYIRNLAGYEPLEALLLSMLPEGAHRRLSSKPGIDTLYFGLIEGSRLVVSRALNSPPNRTTMLSPWILMHRGSIRNKVHNIIHDIVEVGIRKDVVIYVWDTVSTVRRNGVVNTGFWHDLHGRVVLIRDSILSRIIEAAQGDTDV